VPKYLEFAKFKGDSMGFIGENSKYLGTLEFIGTLLVIWLFKNRLHLFN